MRFSSGLRGTSLKNPRIPESRILREYREAVKDGVMYADAQSWLNNLDSMDADSDAWRFTPAEIEHAERVLTRLVPKENPVPTPDPIDLDRLAVSLDTVRGVFDRPLTEHHREVILAACEGDLAAWRIARRIQIGPHVTLAFAVLKQGRPSALQLPPPTVILAALEAPAEERTKTIPDRFTTFREAVSAE